MERTALNVQKARDKTTATTTKEAQKMIHKYTQIPSLKSILVFTQSLECCFPESRSQSLQIEVKVKVVRLR